MRFLSRQDPGSRGLAWRRMRWRSGRRRPRSQPPEPRRQAQGDRHRRASRRSRVWLRRHDRPLHGPRSRGRPALPEPRRMAAQRGRRGRLADGRGRESLRDPQGPPAVRGPGQQPGGRGRRPTTRHSARSSRPSSPTPFSPTGRSTTTPTTAPSRCWSMMPGCKMREGVRPLLLRGLQRRRHRPILANSLRGHHGDRAAKAPGLLRPRQPDPRQVLCAAGAGHADARDRERPSAGRRLHPPRPEPRLRAAAGIAVVRPTGHAPRPDPRGRASRVPLASKPPSRHNRTSRPGLPRAVATRRAE